jgi:uncharacterized protein (TIGR00106 family)
MFGFIIIKYKKILFSGLVVKRGGNNLIISQLSIAPIGKDVSVSKYVKKVIDVIRRYNVKYETNAMSTVIETKDLETLFEIVKSAHMAIIYLGIDRVITELKIDDRRDKNSTIDSKLKSIK